MPYKYLQIPLDDAADLISQDLYTVMFCKFEITKYLINI